MTNKEFNIDISVITPLYHGTAYIANITNMLRRNAEKAKNVRIELIIVNDSPDDAGTLLEISNTPFPVKVVLNEQNMGIHRSRLRGVELSLGRYILFLDQDDEISDDAIRNLYDTVQSGDIAVSDWIREVLLNNEVSSIERIADTDFFYLKRFCRGGNVIGPPGHCLIRRECLPTCWTNRAMTVNGADDFLLWMGMLAEGRRFVHCVGNLYTHKYHEGCFSNNQLNMLASEEEALRIAADEYGISDFWKWIYHRSIRRRKWELTGNVSDQRLRIKRYISAVIYPERLIFRLLDKLKIYV